MSEQFDARPGMVRRDVPEAVDTKPTFQPLAEEMMASLSKGDAIMQMLHLNPTFSFAEASGVYDDWAAKQQAPVVEPKKEEVQVAAPTPAAVAPVTQPIAEPVTPVAPVQAPVKQEIPETIRTLHTHAEPVQAATTTAPVAPIAPAPLPESNDAAQPIVAESIPHKVDFGSQPNREEIGEMGKEDPHRIYTQTDELVGTFLPLAAEEDAARFFSSIRRNAKGQPMFASEAEANKYQVLSTVLELTPPVNANGRAVFDTALERSDTSWTQGMTLPTGKMAGPAQDRGADAKGARAALRRRRQSGSPISLWLPSTGIYVGFRAPLEREMCDFDIRLATETATLGMQTYGLLLSSMSGVYLRHMVEHSLNFAIETTYDCQGNDIKTALIDIVDLDDYWLLILGPIMAKFPTGIPWKLVCAKDDCGHERDVKLNLARCIRMADGLFTDLHRAMNQRQRGKTNQIIGPDDYLAYRKELPHNPASVFKNPEAGLTINFGRSTVGEYLDSTDRWLEEINRAATDALSSNASDYERTNYIKLTAEVRRLTRHAHHVKSIIVEEEVKGEIVETEETDPLKIVEILEDMSSDRVYVLAFENALARYNDLSRMAVLGYMGHACPACQTKEGEEDGPFRGIVTISPDRVFFALSRVVSEIQKVFLQQFGNIG
ncbi:hypothetical protein BIZ83_gp236 [Erwinia phage vB_EamM_ChrisDB]|uniref:hypothetical protein n=1 Tax=Erwinia phage vB_EamM_ChrisDB TaxID=1883371 RepID=UPI00081C7D47|nr:hypothetical protein BIZ83_gp236 [Erwinia phage vB_EamM_ChrisDB]ANZ48617.1 hypothetical protein CHRISDB_55 [Erwinia phage vB_EamM_ChrisDB]